MSVERTPPQFSKIHLSSSQMLLVEVFAGQQPACHCSAIRKDPTISAGTNSESHQLEAHCQCALAASSLDSRRDQINADPGCRPSFQAYGSPSKFSRGWPTAITTFTSLKE
eukprot:1141666-Pelagomonas_calceolata.AAC.4